MAGVLSVWETGNVLKVWETGNDRGYGPPPLPQLSPPPLPQLSPPSSPPLSAAGEDRARYGRDPYAEANADGAEDHPVEVELARRLQPASKSIDRRIRAAQRQLLDALGDDAGRYLKLERLVADRARVREAALFNLGYEQGRKLGRADAVDAARELRPLVRRLEQLAVEAGPRALPSLLLAAWGLSLPEKTRRRR